MITLNCLNIAHVLHLFTRVCFHKIHVPELNNGDYSTTWAKNKRFVVNAMRQFGYTSSALEDKLRTEINHLVSEYTKQQKSPLDPRKHMSKAMANVIFSILINKR